ncbi:hypothetical protein [Olleya sp. HaHaR_3_96]|uniref:hypothetical protein n=1 Tax=Olleya sp. HaHaR_3_96 TaxID=2745560 RepID=UPI001C4FF27C|nr:hypothetical protein [Olleya sp. HaHaR_3_96]QXP58179.1 hypothetical protein H0I26_14825 [Olleya sp. HaHaR_3_96]
MNKIYVIMFTVFLNVTLFSCTPENIVEDINSTQICCGEDGELEPPPPPPPTEGGKITQGGK